MEPDFPAHSDGVLVPSVGSVGDPTVKRIVSKVAGVSSADTHNAGSRQLIPRVENNLHTMPAHGSSHHGWRIIYTQCWLTAAHTTVGE